jgi:hypothetical protein
MWNLKLRFLQRKVSIQKDIQIDGTRAITGSGLSAHLFFHLFGPLEQQVWI